MPPKNEHTHGKLLLNLLLILALALAACNTQPEATESPEHDAAGEDGMEQDSDRVPNDGAAIRIVSPDDGATITGGEVVVEIEVENFELDHDGSHWHVYVDGVSHGMVIGHNFDKAIRGLELGDHVIEVYLSLGTHEELQDGDSVTVTVDTSEQ